MEFGFSFISTVVSACFKNMSGLKLGVSTQLSLLSVLLVMCIQRCYAEETPQKLEVKIYYETLCTDSISFIKRQFHPSMSEKGRYNYTDVQFVPYGKVWKWIDETTNETILRCQHGRRECELNALHACIIENTSREESYNMITCLMSRYRQPLKNCADKYDVNISAVRKCEDTRTIADILNKYGEDTDDLNPSFVPSIKIDGEFNYDEQTDILRSFDEVFCRKYKIKFGITLDDC